MGPPLEPSGTTAIAEFVRRVRPDPRTAFLALRAFIVNLGPDVSERVTPSAVVYMRRERQFIKVEAQRARLMACFPPTIKIEDPMGRLLRRGEEKCLRLESPDDLDGHVQEFVRNAYALAR